MKKICGSGIHFVLLSALSALFLISSSSAAPANDTCTQATALSAGVTKSGTTVGANDSDVWYSFTPTGSGMARITVTPMDNVFDAVIEIYDSCGGIPIAERDSGYEGDIEQLSFEVTAYKKYLIRVAEYYGYEGTFSIQANLYLPPANDLCAYAISLTAGVPKNGTTLGATDSDVWYSYTPTGHGTARITVTPSDINMDAVIEVYGSCGGSLIAFEDSMAQGQAESLSFTAIGAKQYFICVVGYPEGAFSIQANLYLPPANDTCAYAISLTAGVPKNGTTLGATDSDVWYSYTPTGHGTARITVAPSDTNMDAMIEVYDSCGGSFIAFEDSMEQGQAETITFAAIGATPYFIRVSGYPEGAFSIQANLYLPPANDTCAHAIALTSGVSKNGTTLGATDSDVWYSYTPTGHGTAYVTVMPTDGLMDPYLGIFESCEGGFLDLIDNAPENEQEEYGGEVESGKKYILCVGGYPEGNFSIRVDFSPSGTAGDLCSQALVLTDGVVRSATSVGATGYSTCSCSENDTLDVWFQFTPDIDALVMVSITEVGAFDSSVSVYDSCGGNEIACEDWNFGGQGEQLAFEGIAGASYWIRVAGYDGATGAFSILCKTLAECTVSGRITDKYSGEGIGYCQIEFEPELEGTGYFISTTDDQGYYEISLPEGEYEASTLNSGLDGYAVLIGQPVTLSSGMGSLDFQLAPAAVLDLMIVDSHTLEDVTDEFTIEVVYDRFDDAIYLQGFLDRLPEGLFRIQLTPNDPTLYPGSETWVFISEGHYANYVYPVQKGVLVEGHVLDVVGDYSFLYYSGKGGAGYVQTNSEGYYQVSLPPGEYGFSAESWDDWTYDWGWSPWIRTTIPADTEPVAGPDLAIISEDEIRDIRGTIQNPGGYAKSGEFDVVAFQKDVIPSPENVYCMLWDGFRLSSATLNAAGPFVIDDLSPGAYDVYLGIVSWNPENLPRFTVRGKVRNVAAGATNVTLSYTSVGSTVQGKILDSRGNYIVGAEIVMQTTTGDFAGWTRSDSQGRYLYTNVPQGSYRITAVHRKYNDGTATITVPSASTTITAPVIQMVPSGIPEGADLNGDGVVHLDDFAFVASHWLLEESYASDFDASGITDENDWIRMMEFWLMQSVWLGNMPEIPGSLRVTISPQGAIDAGAQWRRTGTTTWYNSGDVETDIAVGTYSIEFKNLAGWDKPVNQNVTIAFNQTTNAGGTYAQHTGSLRVMISPQEAIDAGARWKRIGTDGWYNSGDMETNIATGEYNVEFKRVAGWNRPANPTVTILRDEASETSGTYTILTIPDGLLALWTMDDNAANTTVLDSGDNHFNGTAQRNTSAMTTSGRIDSALAFNGTTDQIDCGTNTALLPDAWTVCAWVKCANVGTPTLLSFGGIRPSIKLQNNNGGRPAILMASNNYRTFEPSAWTTLKDGQWHHVAFTLSGSAQSSIESGQMYLDGVAVSVAATVATGPQTAKSRVFLGNSDAAGSQPFQGAMDDVMLFNRVLSADEIQQVMNRTP